MVLNRDANGAGGGGMGAAAFPALPAAPTAALAVGVPSAGWLIWVLGMKFHNPTRLLWEGEVRVCNCVCVCVRVCAASQDVTHFRQSCKVEYGTDINVMCVCEERVI